jgi:hypothetical protein
MENLTCILDSIEYSPIFDEETALNFMETSLHLIDEYVLLKEVYVLTNELIFETIFEIWLNQLENSYECNHILLQDTYLEEMHDLLEATIQIYMDCFDSYNGSWMLEEDLDKQIDKDSLEDDGDGDGDGEKESIETMDKELDKKELDINKKESIETMDKELEPCKKEIFRITWRSFFFLILSFGTP